MIIKFNFYIHNISLEDLQRTMRVYARESPINGVLFIPPKITEQLDTFDKLDYYEEKYGNILTNELFNVYLDFNTNKRTIEHYDKVGLED